MSITHFKLASAAIATALAGLGLHGNEAESVQSQATQPAALRSVSATTVTTATRAHEAVEAVRTPETSTPPQRWELPIPAQKTIESTGDAVGALIFSGPRQQEEQILDLIWGKTKDGQLGYAVLRTVNLAGETFTQDNPHAFEELIFDADQLKNLTMLAGEEMQLIQVEKLIYRVGPQGHLRPQYLKGSTEEGEALLFGGLELAAVEAQNCCAPIDVTECRRSGDNPCGGPPGTTPPDGSCQGTDDCKCVGGTGSCALLSYTRCNGGRCGGDCPGGNLDKCRQTDSSPVTCDCVGGGGGGDDEDSAGDS